MRAVVFKGVGQVAVEDRPVPHILDARDAIIKVTAAALCGSDLHWYRGHQKIPVGFIPGHEFVGRIHQRGSEVKGFEVGDLVVVCDLYPFFICGHQVTLGRDAVTDEVKLGHFFDSMW